MKEFKTILNVTKIPSVNAMYLSRRNGGRYLNPDYAEVKDSIVKQLIKANIKDYFKDFDENKHVIDLSFAFVYNKRYTARDASNSIKLVEDAVVLACGVDDKFNYSVYAIKLLGDKENKTEKIYVVLSYQDKEDVDITDAEFISNQWGEV